MTGLAGSSSTSVVGLSVHMVRGADAATVTFVVLAGCVPVVVLAGTILTFVLAATHGKKRYDASVQGRQQLMRSFADSRGWSWQEWTTTLNRRWPSAPFSGVRGPNARNVLTGAYRGHSVLVFDYAYRLTNTEVTSSDTGFRTTTTHEWSVCVVRLPAPLPWLRVTRRGWLGRIIATFLPTGRRLPSHAFTRRFKVASGDRVRPRGAPRRHAGVPRRTRRRVVDDRRRRPAVLGHRHALHRPAPRPARRARPRR
ncbi:MAG TPA: hypothetical protein VGJ44_15160 [Kribbellaceae bacterium]